MKTIRILLLLQFTCSSKSFCLILNRKSNHLEERIHVIGDTRFRPNYGGPPTRIMCSAYIGSVSDLSEENMDFSLDFYFRQSWVDYRIHFHDPDNETVVNIPSDHADLIWRPDTFFSNAKTTKLHWITRSNGFIRVQPNGFVTCSLRIKVKALCPMKFHNFPMDHIHCYLQIESFSSAKKDMLYRWSGDGGRMSLSETFPKNPGILSTAVGFHPNVNSLPYMKVSGFRVSEEYALHDDGYNHSRIVIHLFFARNLGYYFIQVYFPAVLMVVTSWISLWLPRNSAPARITLSVTAVLTVVTLTVQCNKLTSLPKLAYLNALDLFLMTCFLFVFLILVEYAIVYYLSKTLCNLQIQFGNQHQRHLALQTRKLVCRDSLSSNSDFSQMFGLDYQRSSSRGLSFLENERYNDTIWKKLLVKVLEGNFSAMPSRIEVASRVLFPLGFIIFNAAYWKYYIFFVQHHDLAYIPGFQYMEIE